QATPGQGDFGKRSEKHDRLITREIPVEVSPFGKVTHAGENLQVRHGFAQNFNGSCGGIVKTEEQLNGGGFARNVQTQEAKDLSLADFKAQVRHADGLSDAAEMGPAVTFGDRPEFNDHGLKSKC